MPTTTAAPAPVHYEVAAANPQAHLYQVTLTIAQPQARQTVSLPVWIPGSYLVREFAKNLQNLQARQGKRAVPLHQGDRLRSGIDRGIGHTPPTTPGNGGREQ